MRKSLCLIVAALLLPLFASAQSIVGTWTVEGTGTEDGNALATLTFNEDGTFVRHYAQGMTRPDGNMITGSYHEEGTWQLINGGKKVMMKVKPSSINVDAGKGVAGGVGKVIGAFAKVDNLLTIYTPKIISLTDTELILRETYDDSDGDTMTMKVKYLRD